MLPVPYEMLLRFAELTCEFGMYDISPYVEDCYGHLGPGERDVPKCDLIERSFKCMKKHDINIDERGAFKAGRHFMLASMIGMKSEADVTAALELMEAYR